MWYFLRLKCFNHLFHTTTVIYLFKKIIILDCLIEVILSILQILIFYFCIFEFLFLRIITHSLHVICKSIDVRASYIWKDYIDNTALNFISFYYLISKGESTMWTLVGNLNPFYLTKCALYRTLLKNSPNIGWHIVRLDYLYLIQLTLFILEVTTEMYLLWFFY